LLKLKHFFRRSESKFNAEPGDSNIEVTHHLSERKDLTQPFGGEAVEIAEAIVLAIVAIATAWSGIPGRSLDWN
jgi:hypothetical protein